MTDFPDDEEFPLELVDRRNAYCQRRSLTIDSHPPGIGLEAIVWPTTLESMLKVHRNVITFDRELAVYQRLAARGVSRLQGFDIPQLLHYDAELLVVELSFVFPPYILDFGAASVSPRPPNFDLERIEAEFARQHGRDWPDIRRLLESLMQLGIYYSDAHDQNIRPG